jgi:hypothetical protein
VPDIVEHRPATFPQVNPKAKLLTVTAIGAAAMALAFPRIRTGNMASDLLPCGIDPEQAGSRVIPPTGNTRTADTVCRTSSSASVASTGRATHSDSPRPVCGTSGPLGRTHLANIPQVPEHDSSAQPPPCDLTRAAERAFGNPDTHGTRPLTNRSLPSLSKQAAGQLMPSEPVILTDPGSILPENPSRDAALLESASQLVAELAAPGHSRYTPEYLSHWNRTVDLSNQLLRQRYGGQVWMAHHIQSHHLMSHPPTDAR